MSEPPPGLIVSVLVNKFFPCFRAVIVRELQDRHGVGVEVLLDVLHGFRRGGGRKVHASNLGLVAEEVEAAESEGVSPGVLGVGWGGVGEEAALT